MQGMPLHLRPLMLALQAYSTIINGAEYLERASAMARNGQGGYV